MKGDRGMCFQKSWSGGIFLQGEGQCSLLTGLRIYQVLTTQLCKNPEEPF